MKFKRLYDPLLEVLFENDDIVAVDKPYGLDSHTNESKKGNEGYVVPGLIEIFEAQLETNLHIIHRLDRTTSGVIVFGKSLESAKTYQQFFRNRETKKTYVFVTAARSAQAELKTDVPILHKGDELEASTSFKRLARTERFDFWQASPHTGRNHQIRIHAAHVGIPLLGDAKYGGAEFPFICLHNRRMVFPNGIELESEAPAYFADLALLEHRDVSVALHAVDRRNRLFRKTVAGRESCLRLIHETSVAERASNLDVMGETAVLSWYIDTWSDSDERLYDALSTQLKKPILVKTMSSKLREKSARVPDKILGEASVAGRESVWQIREGETIYELRADANPSVGLSSNQRVHREWVKQNSSGKRVLNLFSGTGGYALVAAMGGATEVILCESSKSNLNWARKNFELNRFTSAEGEAKFKFLNRDSLQFLDQTHAKQQKFDLILCDTPSFSRGEKALFRIEHDFKSLLEKTLRLLNPDGSFLFTTQFDAFFVDDLRRALESACQAVSGNESGPASRAAFEITNLQGSLDFELPGQPPQLKSFLISRVV